MMHDMPYQYKREPLTPDEANRLANACQTHEEKLIVWTLLDTGLRVAELANLTRDNLDWQNHRLMIYGKGGPYGKQSKRRGKCTPNSRPRVSFSKVETCYPLPSPVADRRLLAFDS